MKLHSKGWIKGVLIGVLVLMVGCVVIPIREMILTQDRAEFVMLLCVVVLYVAYIVSWLLVFPFTMTVRGDKLIIKKFYRPVIIALADVVRCTPIDREELKGSAQKIAAYGAVGVWGKYDHDSFGSYTLFSFDLRNLYFIQLRNGRRYIISLVPLTEEEKLFMEKLKQADDEVE